MCKKLLLLLVIGAMLFSCQMVGSGSGGRNSEPEIEMVDAFDGMGRMASIESRSTPQRQFPHYIGNPSSITRPERSMQANISSFYKKWSNQVYTTAGGYLMHDYVFEGTTYSYIRGDATGTLSNHTSNPKPQPLTQTEAIGFGLMLMAIMDDGVSNSSNIDEQVVFDSMYNLTRQFLWIANQKDKFDFVVDSHLGEEQTHLTGWAIPKMSDLSGRTAPEDPATDGDVTIAYALLLADTQWGSTSGTVNYKQEALNILGDILKYQIVQTGVGAPRTNLGHSPWENHASRPSDWMIDVYMAFSDAYKEVSHADALVFENVALNMIRNIDKLQRDHSSYEVTSGGVTERVYIGLVPDFVTNKWQSTSFIPAEPWHFTDIDESNPQHFDYNACRVPYRLARAASLYPNLSIVNDHGETIYIKDLANRMNGFLIRTYYPSTGLKEIPAGMKLDGTNLYPDPWSDGCFNGSFMAAAITSGNQSYINAMYDTHANYFEGWGPHTSSTSTWVGYFADTITLISHLVTAGYWWAPDPTSGPKEVLLAPNQSSWNVIANQKIVDIPKFSTNWNCLDENSATTLGFENKNTIAHDPFLIVNLPQYYDISRIEIDWYGEYYPTNFIYGDRVGDSNNWNTYPSNATLGTTEVVYPAGVNARSIGIQAKGYNNPPYFGVEELRIYVWQ